MAESTQQPKDSPHLDMPTSGTESPLASSTPLQPQSTLGDESESSLLTQGHLVLETEETPLLPKPHLDLENQNSNALRRDFLLSLLSPALWRTLAAVSVIAIVCVIVVRLADPTHTLSEAFTTELLSVAVLEVHDKGVAVQVVGLVTASYDNIPNPITRWLTKAVSLAIGGVLVVPRRPIEVFLSAKAFEKTHVLSILPSEIPVDLINNRVSEVDFISDAYLDENGLERLAAYTLTIEDNMSVNIEAQLVLTVQGKWFSASVGPVSIFNEVKLPRNDLARYAKVENTSISLVRDSLEISVSVALEPMPIHYTLPALNWNIALSTCNGEYARIGNWRSDAFTLSPIESAPIKIHGQVSEFESALLRPCLDGVTPLNIALVSALENGLVTAKISADLDDSNKDELPSWLQHSLTNLSVIIDCPVPSNITSLKPAIGFGALTAAVTIVPNKDRLSMIMDVSGTAEASVPAHDSSEIVISRPSFEMELLDNNTAFLSASVGGNGTTILQPGNSSVVQYAYDGVSLNVSDPVFFGQKVNTFLNSNVVEPPAWDLHVREADLSLAFLSTTLKNLHFKSDLFLSEVSSSKFSGGFAPWLLKHMNMLVDTIFLAESSEHKIDFVVDMQITNPLNVSLDIPSDTLAFEYSYNGTKVGQVFTSNLHIPDTNERINTSMRLTLEYDSEAQRVLAEEFMSQVISASSDLYIGLGGSHAENDHLSSMLNEIRIDRIKVPELKFGKTTSDSPAVIASSQRKSPFLVEATFHVWTSEIELVIFNPIENVELHARIAKCMALYQGETLATIDWSEVLIIPPGIYTSPRIPINISKGLGADILRKAMNGDLAVDVLADLRVLVDKFPAELLYKGSGLTAKVKL